MLDPNERAACTELLKHPFINSSSSSKSFSLKINDINNVNNNISNKSISSNSLAETAINRTNSISKKLQIITPNSYDGGRDNNNELELNCNRSDLIRKNTNSSHYNNNSTTDLVNINDSKSCNIASEYENEAFAIYPSSKSISRRSQTDSRRYYHEVQAKEIEEEEEDNNNNNNSNNHTTAQHQSVNTSWQQPTTTIAQKKQSLSMSSVLVHSPIADSDIRALDSVNSNISGADGSTGYFLQTSSSSSNANASHASKGNNRISGCPVEAVRPGMDGTHLHRIFSRYAGKLCFDKGTFGCSERTGRNGYAHGKIGGKLVFQGTCFRNLRMQSLSNQE